jgi:hypothetical protein
MVGGPNVGAGRRGPYPGPGTASVAQRRVSQPVMPACLARTSADNSIVQLGRDDVSHMEVDVAALDRGYPRIYQLQRQRAQPLQAGEMNQLAYLPALWLAIDGLRIPNGRPMSRPGFPWRRHACRGRFEVCNGART